MNRWASRNLVYPTAVFLRGEDVWSCLRQYEKDQWESPERIRELQWERLSALFKAAYQETDFYRRAMDQAGVSPASMKGFEAFRRLPTVGKTDLQERRESMLSKNRPRKCSTKTTGGSTGVAVTLLKSRQATAWEQAASWLGYGWAGVRLGDRQGRFWGTPLTLRSRWKYRMIDWVMNRVRCSAFAFTEKDMAAYFRRCKSFGVDWLYGYVSMIDEFARFVKSSSLEGESLRLKCVVTTSEVLTEVHRKRISDAFGCPVFNEYGCGEVGAVAYECEKGGLHVMADNVYLEVLEGEKPVAPGTVGDIVVTELNNTPLPLIRYRLGDRGAIGSAPCPCGRGFPVLEKVVGRAYDMVRTADGRVFHGEIFMYIFEELRRKGMGVTQFQVVQESLEEIRFRVVQDGDLRPDQKDFLRMETRKRLGEEVRISFERADEIERLASGKMRLIVSRL